MTIAFQLNEKLGHLTWGGASRESAGDGEAGRDRAGVGGAPHCGVQGGQAEPLLGQGQGEDQKSISFGVRSAPGQIVRIRTTRHAPSVPV